MTQEERIDELEKQVSDLASIVSQQAASLTGFKRHLKQVVWTMKFNHLTAEARQGSTWAADQAEAMLPEGVRLGLLPDSAGGEG